MMQNSIIKIGLTGGIGTGKSTVSSYIKSKNISIIDADLISREVLSLYPAISQLIKLTFGKEFFTDNDELNRREFGKFIFSNAERIKTLEAIIIPYIKKEILKRIELCKEHGEKLCIIDAPTLIEQELYKEMDYNLLVIADEEIQIKRVMLRDNLSKEEVVNRINAQMSIKEKANYVNFIIDNNHHVDDIKKQVDDILIKIMNENSEEDI